MEFSPSNAETTVEQSRSKLTAQDLQDREDFLYLLSIMEKQGVAGITQPLDYEDALTYKNRVDAFRKRETLEGSVVTIFNDVIFDFDGVLYDSTYSVYRAVELTLERKGGRNIPQPSTVEEIANSYQAPFQNYYKRFGISLKTPEEIASFRDTYREVQARVNSEHHTPSTFYPEVKTVLDKLKEAKKENPKLKIHIISAGSDKQVKTHLVEAGILDDFDEIHTEYNDKTAMIKSIVDKNEEADKVVMVGDLPSDIKDAQKIEGVKTIAVARGDTERQRLGMYLPDYIVADLEGILSLKSYSKELREKSTE
ncbi:MAG: hypothetical protein QG614_314 [Patescibacteria group bacterium]|nr:hypothetical protein [Patescibacteria group bacterium]